MKKLSIVVSAFVLFSLVACTRDNVEEKQQILLKSQEFVLEYGESVSKNAGYYLDNDETFLENVSLESYVVNESKEKNYPKVGEYEISLIYGEQTEKVKIIVKDTRAPEFVDIKDKYEVDYNTKLKTDVFKAKDLSDVTITLDDSQVNYKKAGEYKAVVIAKDASNNETKTEITITVKEQEKTTSNQTTTQNKQETTSSNNNYTSTTQNNTETTKKPEVVEPKEEIIDLAVPHHDQYAAGAPMGCEAASLLQALQYKGYAKGYDLSSFLKEMPYADDNNPFHGYAGSPYKGYTDGIYQSIFPEPLANWGRTYGNVSDFSGKSATDVINQVKQGNPVVVFVVYKYGNPKWIDWTFTTGTYRLVDNSHVMTVSGYNPETKQVKVTDPANSAVKKSANYWVSWSDFKRCYEYMKFAVVVK